MYLKSSRLIQSESLRDKVYGVLKQMIIYQEIPLGEKIDEDLLTKQLGVSRTPIRESLCRLESEGIVKIIPRRGAVSVKHSKKEIVDILQIREVLEGLAVRLATLQINESTLKGLRSLFTGFSESNIRDRVREYTQADHKFHNVIIENSQNLRLVKMANSLNDLVQMLRLRTVSLKGGAELSLLEHLDIIGAMEKKDAELAESLMQKHIRNVQGSVLRNIQDD